MVTELLDFDVEGGRPWPSGQVGLRCGKASFESFHGDKKYHIYIWINHGLDKSWINLWTFDGDLS